MSSGSKKITASMLFNYIQCPHRVWRDLYGPQEEKNPEPNPFVQLLWDKGAQHEENIIQKFGDIADLSAGTFSQRFENTIKAMKDKVELIYQGVVTYDNLLGIPDLLRHNGDGTYTPIDIKSGSGYEGTDDEDTQKYKKHYAIQLCHYLEILKKLGFTNQDTGLIIDIHKNEVIYDLTKEMGIRNKNTWWNLYYETRNIVQDLIENKMQNKPAMAGICKLCPWYKSCKSWVIKSEDLTAIFYLGRSKRDVINEDLGIERIEDILNIDITQTLHEKNLNKEFLQGIGETTLRKIVTRAHMLHNKSQPVIYKQFDFPNKSCELFFDIEDDPTQELVYLHGVYERSPNGERFIPFVADNNTAEAEEKAWADFWEYIRTLPKNDYAIYYYAPHEKTTYKKMQETYPNVISVEELDEFFDPTKAVDLYTHVIAKSTDWPLGSYSLKEIAQYIGFKWRDTSPSGALSIQWYNEYLTERKPEQLNRILEYNEDDCKATMVIKDFIENLQKSATNER